MQFKKDKCKEWESIFLLDKKGKFIKGGYSVPASQLLPLSGIQSHFSWDGFCIPGQARNDTWHN
jgi:hypothetical protein